jgi:hypothetical protein
MKKDEALGPVVIGLLGRLGINFEPNYLANSIEKADLML